MAYKDSGELPINTMAGGYQLGKYTFNLHFRTIPMTGLISAIVTATGQDGRIGTKTTEFPSTTEFKSWHVEANETEASVYVDTCFDEKGNLKHPIPTISGTAEAVFSTFSGTDEYTSTWNSESYVHYFGTLAKGYLNVFAVADKSFQIEAINTFKSGTTERFTLIPQLKTINGKSCYIFDGTVYENPPYISTNVPIVDGLPNDADFYSILYDAEQETLVARFAIDLHDAGGTGTDSDWEDPGDWDQDRDPASPRTTLRLNITGASAGTHSGVPAAPQRQTIYGSGGAGGNGGGGGAGASTVIVYKFATDRADSKEITATARGPGAGSSGGPGGKGGDGCILIFY